MIANAIAALAVVVTVVLWLIERRDRRRGERSAAQEREALDRQVAALTRLADTAEAMSRPATRAHLSATIALDPTRHPIRGTPVFQFATVTVTNRGAEPATLETIDIEGHADSVEAGAVGGDARELVLAPGEAHQLRLRFRTGAVPPEIPVIMRWSDSQGHRERLQRVTVV